MAKEDNINETSSSDLEIQGIQGIGPTFRANNDEWGPYIVLSREDLTLSSFFTRTGDPIRVIIDTDVGVP